MPGQSTSHRHQITGVIYIYISMFASAILFQTHLHLQLRTGSCLPNASHRVMYDVRVRVAWELPEDESRGTFVVLKLTIHLRYNKQPIHVC